MALALQREPTAYCSQLMVAGMVLADPELMLARLVRGCIALAFTAFVLVKRLLSYMMIGCCAVKSACYLCS